MSNSILSKVFDVEGDDDMRKLYDEWAQSYDADILETGYATPMRVAVALKEFHPDPDQPILDFGCGTGLSGEALKNAGFTNITGTDLSEEMLRVADNKGIYQRVWTSEPNKPPSIPKGHYSAITAIGVISYGAAPLSVYDGLIDALQTGGLFAFSFNDQSLAEGSYEARVQKSVDTGEAEILFSEYGPHLTKHGKNTGSKVFVLKRL